MRVVSKLLELLASKNDLSLVIEDLLNFIRRVFPVFQYQWIERLGFVDFFLAGRACHAMIGIRSAPAFQLRIAGNVTVDRADDAHFLFAREIGNRLPRRHEIFSAFDVKFAVVQNEVALRVDIIKNCLVGFHQIDSEVFWLVRAPIVTFELQREMVDVEFALQQMTHLGQHSIAVGVGRDHRMR